MGTENFPVMGIYAELNYQINAWKTFLPKDQNSVLDLGVGTGSSTLFLAKKSRVVVGIDNDREILETAKHRIETSGCKNFVFFLCTVEELQDLFLDSTFSYVNSYASFHHLSKSNEVLSSVRKVLREGKVFPLYDPVFAPDVRYAWISIINQREQIHFEGDQFFFSLEEFQEMHKNAGLRILAIEAGSFPRNLNEWVKGGIKTKNSSLTSEEEALKERVISLFKTHSRVQQALSPALDGDGNWTFKYSTARIVSTPQD